MPSPCAFCASLPLTLSRTPFLSPLSPTFSPTYSRFPRHHHHRRSRAPPVPLKRPRPRPPTPPFCTFNKNRNSDQRLSQVTDALLSAGRFLQSGPGQLVLWGGLVWLVLTGRIGVLFDSFLLLFAVLTVVPVVAVLAFRWWVARQLVQGVCPSCNAPVTGLKGQPFRCTTCGNTVEGGRGSGFSVKDPSSATIDIDAKQVD